MDFGLGPDVLGGYVPLLARAALTTLQIVLASAAVALFLGVVAAWARLSHVEALQRVALVYTSVVRGVPDIVLMLLLYFSAQQALNAMTESLGWAQWDIPSFSAACLSIGLVMGSYCAETIRGALKAVPHGQIEAAYSLGMTPLHTFTRIWLPQASLHAMPGLTNNAQVLIKSTGIVSILGLNDIVHVAQQAGRATNQPFLFLLVACSVFLVLTASCQLLVHVINKKLSFHTKRLM